MQVPDWWPEFLTLRPKSDYQSRENPLQLDRIPRAKRDDPAAELDLPTQSKSPEENRRYIRRFFRIAVIVGAVVGMLESFLTTRVAPSVGEHVLFLGALAVFLYYDLMASRRHWWVFASFMFGYVVLLIAVTWAAVDFLTTPFLFLVATIAVIRLADRMTELNLYLATTAPTPKAEAQLQRKSWNWSRLIFPFFRCPYGLEFYGVSLACALLPAVLLFVYRPYSIYFPGLLAIVFTVLAPVGLSLILELFAAVWSRRRVLLFPDLRRGLRSAISVWFTYDRQDTQAPGVLKSPVGGHKARWRMSLACLVLLAVAIAQSTGWWRAILVKWELQKTAAPEAFLYLNDKPIYSMSSPASAFADSSEPSAIFAESKSSSGDLFHESEPESSIFADSENDQVEDEKESPTTDNDSSTGTTNSPPTHPFFLPMNTGSYVEDQKALQQNMALLFLGTLYLKVIWYYPVIAAAFVPALLFRVYVLTVAARFACLRLREAPLTSDPACLSNEKDWEGVVDRLRASDNKHECESLFLGVNAYDHTPVVVPVKVFEEHAHMLGDSGSGKTALGLAPLMSQLIRFGRYSIVVIDLKGDEMSLFQNALCESERTEARMRKADREAGRPPRSYPFRWFTSEFGRSTFVFNPLLQPAFHRLSISQKADILTSAMGLQYGTGYGEGYYAESNAELLRRALRLCPNPRSFSQLATYLNDRELLGVDRKLFDAASHVRSIVRGLAETPVLNVSDPVDPSADSSQVGYDITNVFRSPEVLYFYLPSAIGTASNAEFARFVLYSLLLAAKHASRETGPDGLPKTRTQVFLFIDEFQRIVSNNLELFLQQARSMNIGVILANQTLADLRKRSVNLIPSVRANCRFKQMFSVTDVEELQHLSESGGDSVSLNLTLGQHLDTGLFFEKERGKTVAGSEQSLPRLSINDILLAGDHPNQSIVQIRRGAGYAQYGGMPFVLHSEFHIDETTYGERQAAAWPDSVPGTIKPDVPPPEPSEEEPDTPADGGGRFGKVRDIKNPLVTDDEDEDDEGTATDDVSPQEGQSSDTELPII